MYVDSDYACDTEDRKLMSSLLAKISNATVYWGARKSNAVALSTSEAGYCAMSVPAQDSVCIRKCLEEARVSM